MVRLLTFSSLYPNAVLPHHGVFVENRLRQLLATGAVESRVVAPVPWFPWRSPLFGEYAQFASVPHAEVRHDIIVEHPRYFVLPKVGMGWTPGAMVRSCLPHIKTIIEQGYDFDVLDAHYFYPDGVAAVRIGQSLNKPVTITARGTDLNLIPKFPKPREMIRWAAEHADALVTVCQALKDVLVQLGVSSERIRVLRNGVNLQLFRPPKDRAALRARLGMHGRSILSVGHLVERKGHHLVIQAMQKLPDVTLFIAGKGVEANRLRKLAVDMGVGDRVSLLGAIPHEDLRDYYGAVDVLVLASSREGWANVLLEAMACGTPVVATSIWGTPEVVAAPEAGILVATRTAEALAQGVRQLFNDLPDRSETRRYAERFSWDETIQGSLELYQRVAGTIQEHRQRTRKEDAVSNVGPANIDS